MLRQSRSLRALIALLLLCATPPLAQAVEPPWSLHVAGYGRAVLIPAVLIPGADAGVPLIAAFGGSWDRPEWLCEMLARATRGSVHLLCLRGRLRPERPADGPRWSPAPVAASEGELRAGLDAASRALGVAPAVVLLAGFSRGAGIVAQLAQRPALPGLAGVLLVEGGHAQARRLLKQHARVALGCGTRACARAAVSVCRGAGERCLARADLRVGHSYNPPWEEQGAALIAWLLQSPAPDAPPAAAPLTP